MLFGCFLHGLSLIRSLIQKLSICLKWVATNSTTHMHTNAYYIVMWTYKVSEMRLDKLTPKLLVRETICGTSKTIFWKIIWNCSLLAQTVWKWPPFKVKTWNWTVILQNFIFTSRNSPEDFKESNLKKSVIWKDFEKTKKIDLISYMMKWRNDVQRKLKILTMKFWI
jgi:hypothetical protein